MRQIACDLTNLIKVYSSSKKTEFFGFSLPVALQLILKYPYTLDVLIPHIVHMTYFDYTLPVLQNFEKTKCVNELHSCFL